MTARFIALASLLFGAEIVGSWWVWSRTPTDTIRVWYSGFWPFEAGRLHYWFPVSATVLVLWIVVWYAFLRGRPLMQWLFTAVLGAGLEVVTSVLYWRSPRSSNIRGLYESVWVWNRVPQANEMGWPSFRVYLGDHLVPWIVVLVIFSLPVWYLRYRKHHSGAVVQGTPQPHPR